MNSDMQTDAMIINRTIFNLFTRSLPATLFLLVILWSVKAEAQICATPGKDGNGGTLSGVVNTYYPGSASVTAGATSITVGAATGASVQITSGDLLLVIQMQDASITSSNNSRYGDNVNGGIANGYTSANNTGRYEFVKATNTVPLTGGTITIQGGGATGGLINAYTNANATNTQGQRRFQVVRVPQYKTATIGSAVTALAWNGSTGGILAMHVVGAVTLNGTVSVTGLGFRGGAGRQLTGGSGGSGTDYVNISTNNFHGMKGEGIAGTPRFVWNAATSAVVNTGAEGYPFSASSTQGATGRGAPGTAGGGGTDSNPAVNDENSGGGGGGNGGAGGVGGNAWTSNDAVGGYGGAAFAQAAFNRLVLGGGGGAGTRNNSDGITGASSGAAGGGIVMIIAGALNGTGTIQANGADAFNNTANDGGGGGGAGGSVLIAVSSGGLTGLTVQARGGRGGDAWRTEPPNGTPGERHGPGGGGGGGVVMLTSAAASISVTGGSNGITTTASDSYGSAPGSPGISLTTVNASSIPGFKCGITTPVTLCYIEANRRGEKVEFKWSTATEVGNVGFNLYAETQSGLQKINDEMIPSNVIDSTQLQDYGYEAAVVAAKRFYVEDVDVRGNARMHGPFTFNKSYGERLAFDPIDWDAIRAEHEEKESRRQSDLAIEASGMVQIQRLGAQDSYPAVNFKVDRDGLYRVTYEALRDAGVDLEGVLLSKLSLSNRGAVVPIWIVGEKRPNGPPQGLTFGPGAYFEFYGTALNTLYTRTNVYTLRVLNKATKGAELDARQPRQGATPAPFYMETATVERNLFYSPNAPNGDPWYDTRFLARGAPIQQSFTFNLEGFIKDAAPASLSVYLWGNSDYPESPDHHVVAKVNNLTVADQYFDGISNYTLKADIPAGLLQESNNTLSLTLVGDVVAPKADLIYMDRYSVSYPRAFTARNGRLTFTAAGEVFKVNNLPTPNVVVYRLTASGMARMAFVAVEASAGAYSATFAGSATPATYVVSTVEALLAPPFSLARTDADIASASAQYLIISHPNFIDGLAPLVEAREAQGLTVEVVNVEDVYAQFGHGIFDAQAIRSYIAHAARSKGTKYVLLVGGDTYDYHGYGGDGSISFIPSLYGKTGDLVYLAPVDPLYADVNNDGVPDLAIGRFPVRTAQELDSIIAKTLAYGSKSYNGTAVFAADQVDGQSSFKDYSEIAITKLPVNWNVQRAYIDTLGIAQARETLLQAINSGVALTNFIGHSSTTSWTFRNLFSTTDAANLTNADRPTVVVQWGCWNTYYVSPTHNSLGHKLMLSGNRGAAAVTGASTLTEVESEIALSEILSSKLVTPGTSIGMAILSAKKELAVRQRNMVDVLLGWTLLGDPALVIQP